MRITEETGSEYSTPDACGTARHFTLIELLIVIGIIAILGAMLMPALGRALENARRVACSNNIGQLARSVAAHHRAGPGAGQSDFEGTGEVFGLLHETDALQNLELLSCPSNRVRVEADALGAGMEPDAVSYYLDYDMPRRTVPTRAVLADRNEAGGDSDPAGFGWSVNHGPDGVNVLFADGHVRFVAPDDDRIASPYVDEDTDIYADNSEDPARLAWIRLGE